MSSLLVFLLGGGGCGHFVGSEFGQKQSVKLLQNMVYSTTKHPPPPQQHTFCIYCTFTLGSGRGGGGQRECIGTTVHKKGRKYQHDWLYLQSIKSIEHQLRRHLGFGVLIAPSSMGFSHHSFVLNRSWYSTFSAEQVLRGPGMLSRCWSFPLNYG